MLSQSTCSIPGCVGKYNAKGFCGLHYSRWKLTGDPLGLRVEHDEEKRFWAKVEKTEACWNWLGSLTSDGYARFATGHRSEVKAYRWAYERCVGPIPDALQLDHLCSNRRCVNPAHLEPVTARVNVLRSRSFVAVNAAKTTCDNGHSYEPDNLYVVPTTGERRCLECKRRQGREAAMRLRAKRRSPNYPNVPRPPDVP